ncbi:FAD binding domain-containing protein [Aquisalimonas asiatica]|uniref:Carbon-monoxide dehydrogenase medium subunit n=1 Tax=Aquisalimonas asiatica TaxID=406100 RepID=A0A1H8SVW1_9GAMM|nr:xanthine dehydrogenase family protein subunit M [Aquisalimonas asiatica]SEO82791.1 carbon-monoxide dehydrogenase medium subunit [Aquisalimonas asiatica]
MKPAQFAYARAKDLPHALALWAEAGEEAQILAGGQSLIAGLGLRLADTPALIDINHVPDLAGVTESGDRIRIGAMTRHAELARDPLVAAHAPAIAEAAPLIAHPAIQTRGTIGGSLAYADPAAEFPACVVALDAELVVQGQGGERRIPAADFFLGLYETALEPFELLTAIEIPKAGTRRQTVQELVRRHGDYAIVGIVLAADVQGDALRAARVVYFGVGDAPVPAEGAARALEQGDVSAALKALDDDLDPPGDLTGGPETKRHLARVILQRAINALRAQ